MKINKFIDLLEDYPEAKKRKLSNENQMQKSLSNMGENQGLADYYSVAVFDNSTTLLPDSLKPFHHCRPIQVHRTLYTEGLSKIA